MYFVFKAFKSKTELKCQNNLNSHSHGGQSHSEHTYFFLLLRSVLSWEQMAEMTEVLTNGKRNREQVIGKSQLPWGRRGEELTYLRWHLHQIMGLSWDRSRMIGNHSLTKRRGCEATRHSHLPLRLLLLFSIPLLTILLILMFPVYPDFSSCFPLLIHLISLYISSHFPKCPSCSQPFTL